MISPTPIRKKQAKPIEDILLRVKLLKRQERVADDGMVVAQSFFQMIAPNGQPLCEETPTGPMPVILASVPQPIRRHIGIIT